MKSDFNKPVNKAAKSFQHLAKFTNQTFVKEKVDYPGPGSYN
jgi:hypothetical protein